MSLNWPVFRPLRFLSKARLGHTTTTNHDNNTTHIPISAFIPPRGFTLQPATTGHRTVQSHYGPGTLFQGQLNLHLLKPTPSPCQLNIVLTCHRTSSKTSSPIQMFTVEHTLIDNEILAAKKHYFHFTIKFPMCNFPPTFQPQHVYRSEQQNMARHILLEQEVFFTFLAVYGACIAFTRWFPDAGSLIAMYAHPSSYRETFKSASETTLVLYAISNMVDFFRALALATLEASAILFSGAPDILAMIPFGAALVTCVKDCLFLFCLFKLPENTKNAAEYAALLTPIAVSVEQAMYIVGFLAAARGFYTWTYAIGRDKRQVIIPRESRKTR
ncbi:hypothetical protein BG004_001758 [Podila humilis]|nr:hypothetical protein BG004_001758 [Podila humilis]